MSLTAIFGGTFNPFHIGHYEMLKALNDCEDIGKVLIMPDNIPPHKKCDVLASDEERIKMCEIVAKDFPKSELCLIEFEREGRSYTYDTVLELKKRYKNENFSFVMGGDMLVYFDKWYNYELLIKEIPFIVFKRSDTDNAEFIGCVDALRKKGMEITVMDKVIPCVSSTEIRQNFKLAKPLLPQGIYEFLNERGIYNA